MTEGPTFSSLVAGLVAGLADGGGAGLEAVLDGEAAGWREALAA